MKTSKKILIIFMLIIILLVVAWLSLNLFSASTYIKIRTQHTPEAFMKDVKELAGDRLVAFLCIEGPTEYSPTTKYNGQCDNPMTLIHFNNKFQALLFKPKVEMLIKKHNLNAIVAVREYW